MGREGSGESGESVGRVWGVCRLDCRVQMQMGAEADECRGRWVQMQMGARMQMSADADGVGAQGRESWAARMGCVQVGGVSGTTSLSIQLSRESGHPPDGKRPPSLLTGI